MLRLSLIAAILLPVLSACAGQLGGPPPAPAVGTPYSNSAGFTGVGTTNF